MTDRLPSITLETPQRSQALGIFLVKLLDMYDCGASSAGPYLDALTFHDSCDGCTFAPTEVSLSFSQYRSPAVRCLGEVINNCSPASPDITVSRLCNHIVGALERLGGKYDRELLHDLAAIAYSRYGDQNRRLRFGVAVEWPAIPFASLKCYFDFHSDGRDLAAGRLTASFRRLDLEPQGIRAKELLGCRFEEGRCRIMGTDLALSSPLGIRLYTPGARWTLGELRELLAATGRSDQIELLDLYSTSVLGSVTSRDALNNLLVSLVFTSATGREPILKLDAFMPALKPDDQGSYEALCSLAENLEVPVEQHAKAFRLLSQPDGLSHSQRMLQYLSVDFLPSPRTKLNAYFRLPGTETWHMELSVRPRRNPHKIWLIDEACRNAVGVLERERLTQYEETIRRMEFPRTAEAPLTQGFRSGEQFPGALIVSALLDAERTGYLVDRNGLNRDIASLLSTRSCNGVHGSKFFSSLPAMPSEVDELAQMIQVLCRVEYPELSEIVEPLLQAIEESSCNEDGSFETWIAGSCDEPPTSALMTRSDHIRLGTGPHPAVIANMLYAAWIYNPERYRGRIGGAIRYLAACQQSDGSWPATWH